MDNQVIGIIGAFITLIAFLGNQSNKLKNDSYLYDGLNFVGSLLLLIYALALSSTPFAILNIVWGGVSLKDLISRFLKSKKIRFTVE
jgi:hypothetical protein